MLRNLLSHLVLTFIQQAATQNLGLFHAAYCAWGMHRADPLLYLFLRRNRLHAGRQ